MAAPDFIGLGAQKAGTSWLAACLDEHPRVCLPTKELHFFSRARNWERGYDWYEDQFSVCNGAQARGEFSTSYLVDPETPARIADRYPDVRLLVSLRDPVERAVSNWRNDVMAGAVGRGVSFGAALAEHPEYVAQGRYAVQLRRFLDCFPRHALLVLVHDELVADPAGQIAALYRFIGVDDTVVPPSLRRQVNPSKDPRSVAAERAMTRTSGALDRAGLRPLVRWARRSGLAGVIRRANARGGDNDAGPMVADADRARLQAELAPDVAAVEELLGRPLPGWRA